MLFHAEKAPTRRSVKFVPLFFVAAGAGAPAAYAIDSSYNWAGYFAEAGSGNNFTDIQSTWVVPQLKAPATGTSYCATWIGFDGVGNTTVEQAGVDEQITSGGTISLFAWYEFAPSAPVPVAITVNPGDTIAAQVTYTPAQNSGGNFAYLFTIHDVTNGGLFSQTEFTNSNDPRSSAEWITEAPTVSGSIAALANFGGVAFTKSKAAINGGSDLTLGGLSDTGIEMLQQSNNAVIALPSAINVAGNAFTTFFGSSMPNLVWKDTSGNKTWDTTTVNWNNGTNVSPYGDSASVTFNDSNGGSANYAVTLSSTVVPASITVNNSSGNYSISGSGQIVDTGSLSKSGSSIFAIDTASSSFGPVSISAGSIQLGASTGLTKMTSLSITGSGTLDINNNHIIINYGGGSDPVSSIAALLATGYNAGHWNGAGGIVSSAAALSPTKFGVGYADSADPGNPAGLSAGTIEVEYTLLGDADLNHIVNGIDFGIVAANFNQGVSRWDQGDFDYTHIVNGVDFGDLAANFNQGANGASADASLADFAALEAFAAANGLMADVPEPISAGMLGIAAAGILRRRLRRCR